ncbi:DUF4189 domain-containing protein [Roseococcus microcysteis]|uniref:DUF4189 domain-containing protein n=1 Tax=Roseococcus microcysteis TaxID=2771361 RepID=UPI00168BCF48|nr:DUF4189 domain-containing protein [Roseococcus microcysteis]
MTSFATRGLWLLGGLCLWLALAPAAPAQTGNPAHDALSARPEAERRQIILQALRAVGQGCGSVARLFPAGLDARRGAYWDVRCADGGQWRIRLPAERFAQPSLQRCGAGAPAPQGGPCFQAVAAAPAGAQPRATASPATAPPPGARFGAIYTTDQPRAAYGFANGRTDRLAVNLAALRACEGMAEGAPCQFRGEIINRCAALAFALTRNPREVLRDHRTQAQNLATTGQGGTQAEAEAAAMEACRLADREGGNCRIMAAGC